MLLIEIKSKNTVQAEDAKVLENLGKDISADRWLISRDPLERQFGSTYALHWQTALNTLF